MGLSSAADVSVRHDGFFVFFQKGLSALVSGGIFPPVLFQSRFIIFFFYTQIQTDQEAEGRSGSQRALGRRRPKSITKNKINSSDQKKATTDKNLNIKKWLRKKQQELTSRSGGTLLPDCQDCQCLCFLFEEGLIWCCAATRAENVRDRWREWPPGKMDGRR